MFISTKKEIFQVWFLTILFSLLNTLSTAKGKCLINSKRIIKYVVCHYKLNILIHEWVKNISK